MPTAELDVLAIAKAGRSALAEALGLTPDIVDAPTYEIVNEADDVAVVRIYDSISKFWGVDAASFVRDLAAIEAPSIRVEMNSPGGSVFDGIAIFNALRAHPSRIVTRADSLVASIASVIFQAGDERQMMTGSEMMIHKAWGVVVANADEALAFAELLSRQDDKIAGIYAAKGSKTEADYLDLMAEETWLTPTEALDIGLTDLIVDPSDTTEDDDEDTEANASTHVDPKNSPTPAHVDFGASWVREHLSAETSA